MKSKFFFITLQFAILFFSFSSAFAEESGLVVTVNSDEELEAAISTSELPVLIDFGAPWCPSCRDIAPRVEKLAKQYRGKVLVLSVNVDAAQGLSKAIGLKTLPSFLQVFGSKDNREMSSLLSPDALSESLLKETANFSFAPNALALGKKERAKQANLAKLSEKERKKHVDDKIIYSHETKLASLPMQAFACHLLENADLLEKLNHQGLLTLDIMNRRLDAENDKDKVEEKYDKLFEYVNRDLREKLLNWINDFYGKDKKDLKVSLESSFKDVVGVEKCSYSYMPYSYDGYGSKRTLVLNAIAWDDLKSGGYKITIQNKSALKSAHNNTDYTIKEIGGWQHSDHVSSIDEVLKPLFSMMECAKKEEIRQINERLNLYIDQTALEAYRRSRVINLEKIQCEKIERELASISEQGAEEKAPIGHHPSNRKAQVSK